MKNYPSLKRHEDFQKVYGIRKFLANRDFVLYRAVNPEGKNRIGISAGKKLGNSVERHRITRRLREIFRKSLPELKPGFDLVLVVRKPAMEAGFKELEASYRKLVMKSGLLKEGTE